MEIVGTHIKRRIAQNMRYSSSSELRKMSGYFGGNCVFYRRQFVGKLGIQWTAAIDAYIKERLLVVFGNHVVP